MCALIFLKILPETFLFPRRILRTNVRKSVLGFQKEVIEHKMCALIFLKILPETILIPRRFLRTVSQMYVNLCVKYPYSCTF